jgi:hypothetical protein
MSIGKKMKIEELSPHLFREVDKNKLDTRKNKKSINNRLALLACVIEMPSDCDQ